MSRVVGISPGEEIRNYIDRFPFLFRVYLSIVALIRLSRFTSCFLCFFFYSRKVNVSGKLHARYLGRGAHTAAHVKFIARSLSRTTSPRRARSRARNASKFSSRSSTCRSRAVEAGYLSFFISHPQFLLPPPSLPPSPSSNSLSFSTYLFPLFYPREPSCYFFSRALVPWCRKKKTEKKSKTLN